MLNRINKMKNERIKILCVTNGVSEKIKGRIKRFDHLKGWIIAVDWLGNITKQKEDPVSNEALERMK